jgi:hypothetical protein
LARAPPPELGKAPELYFRFFGMIFVRKADLLAAAAFILAIGSAMYQVGGYLWGAHLHIYAPDRVLIFFDRYADQQVVTRVAGQLTFTNTGHQGRNGTVRDVWVDLTGPGLSTRQHWISFPKITRDGERLNIDQVEDAYPLLVPGEGTVSKLMGFAPRVDDCRDRPGCAATSQYLSQSRALAALAAHIGSALRLEFHAATFQHGALKADTCEVRVTETLVTYLAANDWYMARCAPVSG